MAGSEASVHKLSNTWQECTEEELKIKKAHVESELTNVEMKPRGIQDNKIKISKHHDDSELSTIDESKYSLSTKAAVIISDIGISCDTFVPKESEIIRKPEVRIYPKVALPHSKLLWETVRRVRKKVDRPVLRMTIERQGQFSGVEEEDEKLRWRRSWARNKMNGANDDQFKNWLVKPHSAVVQNVVPKSSLKCVSSVHVIKGSELKPSVYDYPKTLYTDTSKTSKDIKDLTELKSLFAIDNIVSWLDRKHVYSKTVSLDHDGFSKPELKDEVLSKIKSRLNEEMITKIRSLIMEHSKVLSLPGRSQRKGSLPSMENVVDEDSASVASSKKVITVRAKLAAVRTILV